MIVETFLGAGLASGAGIAILSRRRERHYRQLAMRLADIGTVASLTLAADNDRKTAAGGPGPFVITDALTPQTLANVGANIEKLRGTERNYVPAHKQGGTIAYETLIERAPDCVALYHSLELRRLVGNLMGAPVWPTPLHDQSSLSALVYERPGDHIGWHYDHNFYRGRHFTVLIAIENRGSADDGLSHAMLVAREDGAERSIASPPNTLIVFEGARVLHKVTPIIDGERRVMLSMTYCTDPRARWWQSAARRVKDTAFFGIRALWT